MSLGTLALFLLAAAAPARAAFEETGAGARAPGMGDAFAAVADDVYALHYNPAGLGTMERPMLGTAYSMLSMGLTDGTDLGASFAGYAHPIHGGRQGTLAGAWSAFSLNNSLYREDAFTLSYGRLLGNWGGELYGGASARVLRRAFGAFSESSSAVPTGGVIGGGQKDPVLAGKAARLAYDADAGILYRFTRHYNLALTASHIPEPDLAFSSVDSDRLPLTLRAGVNYRSLISNLALQYETRRTPSGREQTASIGVERWFLGLFAGDFGFRGGMAAGSRDLRQGSAGFSYRTKRFQADYAFLIPIGGLQANQSHRVGLSFRFGSASAEEESMELVLEAMKQLKGGQAVVVPGPGKGLAPAEKASLNEALGQARTLESRALYSEALERLGLALTVAPADKELVQRHSRLSLVAGLLKALPSYREEPVEASLHLAVQAYLAGNNEEAVRLAAEALAIRDEDRTRLVLAQLEAATGVRRSSAKAAPDYQASLRLTRANAAVQDGRYEEAIELNQALLRIAPDSLAAWQNLGTAYFALKDYENSLTAWRRAYELEKSPALRTVIRGYLKSIERAKERASRPRTRTAPAAPALPEKPRLDQAEARDLFNRAVDHYTRGELPKAREFLERLVEGDPENVDAVKALNRIRKEMEP